VMIGTGKIHPAVPAMPDSDWPPRRAEGKEPIARGVTVSAATAEPTVQVPELPAVSYRPSGRLGPRWLNYLKGLFGPPSRRRLAHAALQIDKIRYWEGEFSRLSDADIRQRGLQLRGRARGGESLDKLLPETFGLVCVAAMRTLRLRPFDVQLAAG